MKTPQRKMIMNYLQNNTSHPTAREIYDELSKQQTISFATVYNTLEYMKKKGLVRELSFVNFDYKRYEPNMTPHAHLICTDCGKLLDIDLPVHFDVPFEQKYGFDIESSDVSFYGICPECKIRTGHTKQDNKS